MTKHGRDPSPRGKPPFSTDVLSKFTLVFLHPGDYERYATGGVFSESRKVTITRERFIQENEVVRFTSFGIFRKNTSWYWRWSPIGKTRYAIYSLWSKRWRARTRWVYIFYIDHFKWFIWQFKIIEPSISIGVWLTFRLSSKFFQSLGSFFFIAKSFFLWIWKFFYPGKS